MAKSGFRKSKEGAVWVAQRLTGLGSAIIGRIDARE
jgi:hypothetical protein